jgi:peptidyl-prolyl cis-trans isomerase B (cyclophilin B)
MKNLITVTLLSLLLACQPTKDQSKNEKNSPPSTQIVLKTSLGDIIIELSDKTPLHRDNFIKLVEEAQYDSLLFHRVINGFVIQGGDPDSKYATANDTLGNGGLDYTIPAEFDSTLFHKKGALGAARDGNPERASSAMQFYIVQAGVMSDSVINQAETTINERLASHYSYKSPQSQSWVDSLNKSIDTENVKLYRTAKESLKEIASTFDDFEKYTIPKEHRTAYKEIGGTPRLDQNYTVFGQVIIGLNIIDTIAAVNTNNLDRPIKDVKILKAHIMR